MDTFRQCRDKYLDFWRSSNLIGMKNLISIDYKAREISGGEIVDFGYAESIEGWEQGFRFVEENNAQWIVNEVAIYPLRADETLVILTATMNINGKLIETTNLFFVTFKKNSDGEWKVVRSYIEPFALSFQSSNLLIFKTLFRCSDI